MKKQFGKWKGGAKKHGGLDKSMARQINKWVTPEKQDQAARDTQEAAALEKVTRESEEQARIDQAARDTQEAVALEKATRESEEQARIDQAARDTQEAVALEKATRESEEQARVEQAKKASEGATRTEQLTKASAEQAKLDQASESIVAETEKLSALKKTVAKYANEHEKVGDIVDSILEQATSVDDVSKAVLAAGDDGLAGCVADFLEL